MHKTGPYVLRDTPTVERARLVRLRRSHVRHRHWANRLTRHQIAYNFISLATWGHIYVVWRLASLRIPLFCLVKPCLLP